MCLFKFEILSVEAYLLKKQGEEREKEKADHRFKMKAKADAEAFLKEKRVPVDQWPTTTVYLPVTFFGLPLPCRIAVRGDQISFKGVS